MRIAYWVPKKYVTSVEIYTRQVVGHLERRGFEFIGFTRGDKLPEDVDLYWDSTCTGGKHPNKRLMPARQPVVVTVHGAAPLALPLRFTYNGKRDRIKGWFQNQKKRLGWQSFGHKVSDIITVSQYAKGEIAQNLPLRRIPIHVIYHGFDRERFHPVPEAEWAGSADPFFYHVSVYQPKKNIEAIMEAWKGLPANASMPLRITAPGFPEAVREAGLTLENRFVSQEELSENLRKAAAFVFPSLHESFGLPILEAMASGCPVLTSHSTSCGEIGGAAVLQVDPHDVASIRAGMARLATEPDLRLELRRKGLQRAAEFSWERCADEHAKVFETAKLRAV